MGQFTPGPRVWGGGQKFHKGVYYLVLLLGVSQGGGGGAKGNFAPSPQKALGGPGDPRHFYSKKQMVFVYNARPCIYTLF